MLNKINKLYKKMTKIRKSKFFILVLLMLLLPLISPLFSTVLNVNEEKNNFPKSSGHWVMGPLHIDDTGSGDYTWAEAELEDWCSGNGSLLNPYLLENITIDAKWLDNAILIENSNINYFTIRNCTVMNSGTILDAHAGIELMYTSKGTIEDNICLNNIKTGIYLQSDCYNNTIQNNYIYNSSTSLRLYQSYANEVLDNNITEGTTGIYIGHTSDFNTIIDNTITTHTYGIQTKSSSHNNTIVNNYINAITNTGISINPGCNNNTLEMNNINGSSHGIAIGGNGSIIYGNFLTDNSGVNGADNGYYNRWDNGTIGNYWDDYGGDDLDNDGIGDTPYDIPGSANSQDNYPIWDDGLEQPIYIDGEATGVGAQNWTWAVNQPWCTGLGTFLSPYVIEGIGIDGMGNGFCISIQNSEVFFEVRNCVLYNAGFSWPDSAILLNNVGNGSIIGCDLTDTNYVGIFMDNSHNNTFIGNNASDTDLGFLLRNSDFNLLSGNTVNDCIENGINIDDNSDNNSIVENTVIGCTHYGISIFSDSNNNTVSGNTLEDNNVGISMLDHCDSNRILNNELLDNNIGVSINDYNSTNNVVYNNTFLLNTKNGEDESFNINYWNYGMIGNYWDDYGGVDANDDGIGDTPYTVLGGRGRLDNFPIWEDGDDTPPTISVNYLTVGTLFGADAPTYSVTLFDLNLNMSWYTLNNSVKHFFTPINGVNVVPIDETEWDSFSDGFILMSFYVNDSGGNPGSFSHVIIKDATNPTIIIIPSDLTVDFEYIGQSLSWTATDTNPNTYTIELQGSGIVKGPTSWTSGLAINYNIPDGFTPGEYTYIITFTDESGNSISDTVTVTIEEEVVTPGGGIPFGDYYILFLGIGIATLLLVERKKRKK